MSLVLYILTRHPYEPLKKASNKDFTLKTLFLLALASAQRVSDLHGLLAEVCHRES